MNYIKYIVISFLLICSCNKKTVEEESSPETSHTETKNDTPEESKE